jgi:hypothetical protein
MLVELILKNDIYSEPKTPEGKVRIVKKNVITKMTCDPEIDISLPSEIVDNKGKVIEDMCKIYLKSIGEVVVNHSYKYIVNLIKVKEQKKIGFKYGNKKN